MIQLLDKASRFPAEGFGYPGQISSCRAEGRRGGDSTVYHLEELQDGCGSEMRSSRYY